MKKKLQRKETIVLYNIFGGLKPKGMESNSSNACWWVMTVSAYSRLRIVLHHQISASDVQYALSCFQVYEYKLIDLLLLMDSNMLCLCSFPLTAYNFSLNIEHETQFFVECCSKLYRMKMATSGRISLCWSIISILKGEFRIPFVFVYFIFFDVP